MDVRDPVLVGAARRKQRKRVITKPQQNWEKMEICEENGQDVQIDLERLPPVNKQGAPKTTSPTIVVSSNSDSSTLTEFEELESESEGNAGADKDKKDNPAMSNSTALKSDSVANIVKNESSQSQEVPGEDKPLLPLRDGPPISGKKKRGGGGKRGGKCKRKLKGLKREGGSENGAAAEPPNVTVDGKRVPQCTTYRYTCTVKEDHEAAIYGCAFRHSAQGEPLIFATVGSNRVTIYECLPTGSIRALQCFDDPDPDEEFYTCAWTEDDTGRCLLAAGGSRGVIRIFEPSRASCVKSFVGHGHAINDLMFHPKEGNILLSSSRDFSLRLWNVGTGFLAIIFGGGDAHSNQVISADIDIVTGFRMVSCGMDNALKIWKFNKPDVKEIVALSYTYPPNAKRPFPTKKISIPDFSTNKIHGNYIDCVKWYGDLVLSKSVEDEIVCWQPFLNYDEVTRKPESDFLIIMHLKLRNCDIWYMRFSLDHLLNRLTLGNACGQTFLYDLNGTDVATMRVESSLLLHEKCTRPIRQTAFSMDGSVLICVCDDSTIWRWDAVKDKISVVNL